MWKGGKESFYHYLKKVVFGFTLDLWAIRSLILDTQADLGMGLKSNKTIVGYSHKLCDTITLVYFAGRTDCRSRFCGWFGAYPSLW